MTVPGPPIRRQPPCRSDLRTRPFAQNAKEGGTQNLIYPLFVRVGHPPDQGKDASRFFTNTGRMMGPIQRVNVDLAAGMLEELDRPPKS